MYIIARHKKITFQFRFLAGTSRGVLYQKDSWFIILEDSHRLGIGECSPIFGLSIDPEKFYQQKIENVCRHINEGYHIEDIDLEEFPSIRFGIEMAFSDLNSGGKRLLFPEDFTKGIRAIPINGLIWMGDRSFMEKQIRKKIETGFRCIKIKIGAIGFKTEFEILKKLRKGYNSSEIEIRLDANGAFIPETALEKLKILSDLNIHSIEQPIKAGNWEAMKKICSESPIPVALDEELTGIAHPELKRKMISFIQPQYLILKPSLIGGFEKSEEWIEIAENNNTSWWVTSALESNIGLNAIAQWTSSLKTSLIQGLGTGNIYKNNIPSPLFIEQAGLKYDPSKEWDLTEII